MKVLDMELELALALKLSRVAAYPKLDRFCFFCVAVASEFMPPVEDDGDLPTSHVPMKLKLIVDGVQECLETITIIVRVDRGVDR